MYEAYGLTLNINTYLDANVDVEFGRFIPTVVGGGGEGWILCELTANITCTAKIITSLIMHIKHRRRDD